MNELMDIPEQKRFMMTKNEISHSILLVDSDLFYREYIHNMILQTGNFDVTVVDDFHDIPHLLRTSVFEIIFLDISIYCLHDIMPMIDSYTSKKSCHVFILLENYDLVSEKEHICKRYTCIHKSQLAQSLYELLGEIKKQV